LQTASGVATATTVRGDHRVTDSGEVIEQLLVEDCVDDVGQALKRRLDRRRRGGTDERPTHPRLLEQPMEVDAQDRPRSEAQPIG
jgi:hypothetical protein